MIPTPQRPKVISPEEWKFLNADESFNEISEIISTIDSRLQSKVKLSDTELGAIRISLSQALNKLISAVSTNHEWLVQQELMPLIRTLDTSSEQSQSWEDNRELTIGILEYSSVIYRMILQASSASSKLLYLLEQK